MPTDKQSKKAKQIYDMLVTALDDLGYGNYERCDSCVNMSTFGVEYILSFTFMVDAEEQILTVYGEIVNCCDKIFNADIARGICVVNSYLKRGHFYLDSSTDGDCVRFKMTQEFRESLISQEMIESFIEYSVYILNRFFARFLTLGNSVTIDEFISFERDVRKREQQENNNLDW